MYVESGILQRQKCNFSFSFVIDTMTFHYHFGEASPITNIFVTFDCAKTQ
jgi:hypothetical protein